MSLGLFIYWFANTHLHTWVERKIIGLILIPHRDHGKLDLPFICSSSFAFFSVCKLKEKHLLSITLVKLNPIDRFHCHTIRKINFKPFNERSQENEMI